MEKVKIVSVHGYPPSPSERRGMGRRRGGRHSRLRRGAGTDTEELTRAWPSTSCGCLPPFIPPLERCTGWACSPPARHPAQLLLLGRCGESQLKSCQSLFKHLPVSTVSHPEPSEQFRSISPGLVGFVHKYFQFGRRRPRVLLGPEGWKPWSWWQPRVDRG